MHVRFASYNRDRFNSQGDKMSNEAVKKFECVFDYTVEHFKGWDPLLHTSRLWCCDEDFAPQFRNPSGIFEFTILLMRSSLPAL